MILRSEFQKSYFGFGMSLSIIPCVLILRKTDNIDFFGPNLAKKRILESEVWIRNQHLQDCMYASFQAKWQFWLFRSKFTQKRILDLEFQKCKFKFGIRNFNILCVPISSQNGQLWTIWHKFGEIAKLSPIFWS